MAGHEPLVVLLGEQRPEQAQHSATVREYADDGATAVVPIPLVPRN